MGRHDLKCQVCALTLVSDDLFGKNADGSLQPAYCITCFPDGKFAPFLGPLDLKAYSEAALPVMVSHGLPEDQVKQIIATFPGLLYWKFKG